LKPVAIVESTTVTWAVEPRAELSAWRAPELHRAMHLTAHGELAEADGAIYSTNALMQLDLLRAAGVDVAVYAMKPERTVRPFFAARGFTLIDRTWTDTVARHGDAVFVVTPRMTGTMPFHIRTNRAEVVRQLGFSPRAAATSLDVLGITRRAS
jgi:hypothetical protein